MWGKSYVVTPGGIMVPPESPITKPEQLAGQEIAVGYHSGSHFTTIQSLEPFLTNEQIKLRFGGSIWARVDIGVGRDLPAVSVWGLSFQVLEQFGFRKVLDASFMIAFMFPPGVDPADVEKYMNGMKRAQMELDFAPEKYRHYYLNEIPDRYKSKVDVRLFSPGERIVFLPYTEEMYAKTQAWIHERGLFEGPAPTVGLRGLGRGLDLDRGRVIGVEPVLALARQRLLPVFRHGNDRFVLVGKRRVERLPSVLVRFPHDRGRPLPANVFIARHGACRIREVLLQARRNHIRILDGHDAALPEERQCRMAGVAKQSNPSLGPLRHRSANHQRPFERRVDIPDDGLDVRVPTGKVVGQFVRSCLGPSTTRPASRHARQWRANSTARRREWDSAARGREVRASSSIPLSLRWLAGVASERQRARRRSR